MLPSELLQHKRQEILELLKKHPKFHNLRVFGSAARGEDTENSDLDILTDYYADTSLLDLCGLNIDLEKLLGISIHLLTVDDIHDAFKDKVLKDAIPL